MTNKKSREKQEEKEFIIKKIRSFPRRPGVYLMLDSRGKTLYVGKATNLRSRVSSYFSGSNDTRILIHGLLKKLQDINYFVTRTNSEALILENNLIKKHRPVYNIRLKDDKTYLSLKVTIKEKWPRVLTTRSHKEDGSLYFGPYASAITTRNLLRIIKKVFTLRTCSDVFFRTRSRPCIQYEIGRCCAPCTNMISEKKYNDQVKSVITFLRGRSDKIIHKLQKEMEKAASEMEYEHAAVLRDRIEAIRQSMEKQAVQEVNMKNIDVFGIFRDGEYITVQVLFVREGRVLDAAPFHLRSCLPLPEIIRSFLSQFYLAGRDIPGQIILPEFPSDRNSLENILREKRGKKISFSLGKRGRLRSLLDLAVQNAIEAAKGNLIQGKKRKEALKEIGTALGLAGSPKRIECFDISTTGGTLAVGSMAVMIDGKPDTAEYRHFRIKTIQGMDDYGMLGEIIKRRLKIDPPPPLPDLLLVDGGLGQANQANKTVLENCPENIAVAGIAKSRSRKGKQTAERIFLPGKKDHIQLGEETPGSRLLQELRDEAHRFAITYHRKLRRRHALTSGLEEVKGLGSKRIRKLYETFGGIGKLRKLSIKDLVELGKLPLQTAKNLHAYLHPQRKGQEVEKPQ